MAQIIIDSSNNLIQGDFDNATVNNRTKFKTTTLNGTTNVYAVPNGSSTSAGYSVSNNADPTNASKLTIATNGATDTQIISGINGSGSYLPLSFYTNNVLAGQFTTAGNLSVTGTVAGATGTIYPLVSGTSVASTSGTSIDFTSIPSWAKRITVMFAGVVTNATSPIIVQIGAGSVANTGYVGTAGGAGNTGNVLTITSYTTGFGMAGAVSSADQLYNGNMSICLLNSATGLWSANGSTSLSPGTFTGVQTFGGSKTLSGTLDRIRITTSGGTATFTAGSINILYE